MLAALTFKMLVGVRVMSADSLSLFGEKSRPSLRFVRWREGSRSPIGAVESAERNSHILLSYLVAERERLGLTEKERSGSVARCG